MLKQKHNKLKCRQEMQLAITDVVSLLAKTMIFIIS